MSVKEQLPTVRVLDEQERRALFDSEAHRLLGISGAEFVKRWEAGEFDENPDQPAIMRMAMLLPFAR